MVWYTAGKGDHAGAVYALVVGWPVDDIITLGSVKAVSKATTSVKFIGLTDFSLTFDQTDSGLRIHFPAMSHVAFHCGSGCRYVYALKMENVEPASERLNDIEVNLLH